MASEYTDSDQRLAVCTNEYDSNKEDSTQNDEKHIRAVEETDDSYIIEFAKKPDSEETVDEMASKEEAEKESLEIKSSIKAYHDDEEDKDLSVVVG